MALKNLLGSQGRNPVDAKNKRTIAGRLITDRLQADPEQAKRLEKLTNAWKTFSLKKFSTTPNYSDALNEIKGLNYSAQDVEFLSIRLKEFEDNAFFFSWKVGLFLSALINNGADRNYTIHTRQFKEAPLELGLLNTKNIFIEGDAGLWLGHFMISGTIIVNGNSDDNTAEGMCDGIIIINGSTGKDAANYMKGGTIIIKDGVTDLFFVGAYSNGGKIHIEAGECPFKANYAKVELYYKGELVQQA